MLALRLILACWLRPSLGRVPRTIWSFWNDHGSLPRSVRLARASWSAHAPDYKVHFLAADTWQEHLPRGAEGAGSAPGTGDNRFADWLRVQLLARHGGVWIDATIILAAPLSLLVNDTAEISGVHMDGVLFETSFIAAKPGGATITRWRDEFSRIAPMSEREYDEYLLELKMKGIEALNGYYANCGWASRGPLRAAVHAALQGLVALVNSFVRITRHYWHPCGERYWMGYLNLHVAFNVAIGTVGGDARPLWDRLGISAQESKETLSLASYATEWDEGATAAFLLTQRSAEVELEKVRGVKLRSKERRAVEAWDWCEEGSVFCRAQRLAGLAAFEERAAGSARGEL